MNILHRPTLSRRAVLRGLGVSLALPWLEAMTPRALAQTAAAKEPVRTVIMFVPNGMYMPQWTPTETGPLDKLGELPPLLKSLDKHRGDFNIISGLCNPAAAASGIPQKHGVSGASFLTCCLPRPTQGNDVRAGVSFDQLIAQHYQDKTRLRLPSMELSVETPSGTGACDLNCAYTSNISWRDATLPAAREISPRAVFEQLFGDPAADKPAKARASRRQRSVLDYIRDESAALEKSLGGHDRAKLDEFLQSVREIEKRIAASESAPTPPANHALATRGPLPVTPATFTEHARLMIDLLVMALATGQTHVGSIMMGNEFSNRTFPEVNIRDNHHSISHHANQESSIQKYAAICQYCVTFYGQLLDAMKSVREGDGTLLDKSMVLFGCGLGDGNAHDFTNLPILLAGRANGAIKPGRHILYPKQTPLANLYLSLMDKAGLKRDRFADSTGPLPDPV